MKKLAIIGTIVLSGFFVNAQEENYKVLAVKGENAVEKAGAPNQYKPLVTGMKLSSKDKVVLGNGGYLGLASSSGKTVELRKQGIYQVSDLSGNAIPDNSSLAQKYMEYIFSGVSDNAHAKNMSITGSVERSIANVKVDVLSAATTKILLQPSTITWVPKEDIGEFHVSVSNFFDEEIYGYDTKETSHTVDFSKLGMKKNEVYKLTVVKKGDSVENGEPIILKIPEEAEAKSATSMANNREGALQNLVSASYFESNGYYLTSTEMFKRAADMEPEIEDFTNSYNSYLERIGSGK